jgi:hypothetical protein
MLAAVAKATFNGEVGYLYLKVRRKLTRIAAAV